MKPRAWNSTLPAPSKRLARSTELRREAPLRPVNPNRKKAETERAYGPEERRVWVKFALSCVVPECHRRPENMHIEGGGTGRKADATKIAPGCRFHHTASNLSFHHLGSAAAFDRTHGTDLSAAAAETAAGWETWGKAWIDARKADGTYEAMRRSA